MLNARTLAFAALGATSFATLPSPASAAEAYCQTTVGAPDTDGYLSFNDTKQGSSCSTSGFAQGSTQSGNTTFQHIASSVISSDLATGTMKFDTSFVGGGNATAYTSLTDTLSIVSQSAGNAVLTAQLSGYVGGAGAFSFRLLPVYGYIFDAQISYQDNVYYGAPEPFSATLINATFDQVTGIISVPIALQAGINILPLYAIATGVGNTSFGHTVGLGLELPAGATFTSDSGVFLTKTREPITGGVQFGAPPTGAVPEPATWAMMLVGFGMVAGAARYRRRSTAAAIA